MDAEKVDLKGDVISRLGRVGMGAWGRGQDLVSANHRSHLIECLGCPGLGEGREARSHRQEGKI